MLSRLSATGTNYVYQKLENAKQRTKLGISDTEVGDIEDVAFKIIRMRELPGLEKVHKVVRDLPKWLGNADSRKELLELGELKLHLPKKERTDEKGVEYDEREIDKIWARKYTSEVVRQVKRAKQLHGLEKDHETPLALLEAALGKLTHENMNPKAMQAPQLSKALKIAEKIEKRASDLKGTIYRLVKRRKG